MTKPDTTKPKAGNEDKDGGAKAAADKARQQGPSEAFTKAREFLSTSVPKFQGGHPGWARLVVSLTFLFLGLGGVVYVLRQVPAMAAEFVAEQERVRQSGLEGALQAVVAQLGEDELKRQTVVLNRIDATFQSMTQSLGGFKEALPWFSEAKTKLEKMLTDWEATKQSLESSAGNLKKATDWFDAKPAEGAAPATPAPEQKSVREILLAVQARLEGAKTPDAFKQSLSSLRTLLEGFRGLTDALRASDYGNEDYLAIYQASKSGKEIIRKVLKRASDSANLDPGTISDQVSKIERSMPSETTVLVSDPAQLAAISGLQEALSKTAQAASILQSFVATTAETLTTAKTTIETTLAKDVVAKLLEDKGGVLANLSAASTLIKANLASRADGEAMAASAKRAVLSIERLVSTQSDMAFRAASPAYLVMLALCGMFTVFGATSLLRLLKTVEQERMEVLWRQRAVVYVDIVTTLASIGVDSSDLIRELQRIRFNEERERAVIGTPILATMSELSASMGKGKP